MLFEIFRCLNIFGFKNCLKNSCDSAHFKINVVGKAI